MADTDDDMPPPPIVDTIRSEPPPVQEERKAEEPQAETPPTDADAPPAPVSLPPPPPSDTSNNNTPATHNTSPSNNGSSHPQHGHESSSAHVPRFFLGGLLAGLIFGLAPAVYFAMHEKQTRRAISAALAARENAAALASYHGNYRDDLSVSVGKARPTQDDMLDLEEINLEDVVNAVVGQDEPVKTTQQQQPQRKTKAPKMAFGLNKIV